MPEQVTYEELVQQYGSGKDIPNDVLYQFIKRDDIWGNLINVKALGLDILLRSPLVVEVRRRSKADLFWLARYFLWNTMPEGVDKDISENWINEEVHGRLCATFVQKDASKTIAEQDPIYKNRLILYPRGAIKSTVDVCDVVQWVLNFPEIRILYLTAADDLAIGFVDETKGHFVIHSDKPTLMNIFFPEYCVSESQLNRVFGNDFEFTCPIWAAKQIKRKEPTVMASSIASNLSGFHFEVIKADDVVSDKNSDNEDACKKIIKRFYIDAKMIRTFGYIDRIGTRYHDSDMYGEMLEKNIGENIERITGPDGTAGPLWEIILNKDAGLKILIGRGIVIKPETAIQLQKENRPVTYKEAGVDGVHLLFPQHQSYKWCLNEYAKNEDAFEGQINQNPRPPAKITFDRPLLVSHTVDYRKIPLNGVVSQTWDFAFSKKKGRDYTTGSAVMWDDQGRFYVVDLIRARFKPFDLAKAVVDFAKKWRPFRVGIEDAAGSRLIEPTILTIAKETNDPYIISILNTIDWYTPDNQKDAKTIRMAALHPWLVSDKMFFANYLPQLPTVYDEFERCLTSHHHEDIPDVLSQQPRYAPRVAEAVKTKEFSTFSQEEAAWNITFEDGADPFGRLGFGLTPPPMVQTVQVEEDFKAEVPVPGFDPILGAGING